MNRRKLLQSTPILSTALSSSVFGDSTELNIIDSNVSLFHYPYRKLPLDETNLLVRKMQSLGITKAFAGSFQGILHRDVTSVNQRLVEECRPHAELIPIGSINPTLPGWKGDLKRCSEQNNIPGIRLYPSCHRYQLDDPRYRELLELAAEMNLFVQIVATLEDKRTQPETLHVGNLDLAPLAEHSIGKIQILNWRPQISVLDKLASRPEISFDIARVDSTDGVATLLETIPAERVLFGTHAPFLIPEASLIRVHESNLNQSQIHQIMHSNSENFIKV